MMAVELFVVVAGHKSKNTLNTPTDMPKSIELPDEALPDLQKVARLSDQQFMLLTKSLGEAGPALRRSQLEERLAGTLDESLKGDLHALLPLTFFLLSIKSKLQLKPEELVDAVDSYLETEAAETFPLDARQKLKPRIISLLDLEPALEVTRKALDVMTEHEHLFCSARILSDIRPIFSGPANEASAAVIIHNLQVGYHENGEHKEIYFALDCNDLRSLKEVIERAERKTVALEAMIRTSNVSYLEV